MISSDVGVRSEGVHTEAVAVKAGLVTFARRGIGDTREIQLGEGRREKECRSNIRTKRKNRGKGV
jgi:hypothetical protein